MNCNEFEIAVENAIEGRTGLDSIAFQHTEHCLTCRNAWERQQKLDAAIAAWKSVQPSDRLVDSVLLELASSVDPVETDCLRPITEIDEIDLIRLLESAQSTKTVLVAKSTERSWRGTRWAMVSLVACLAVAIIFAQKFANTRIGDRGIEVVDFAQDQVVEIADANLSRDYSETVSEVISELKSEYNGFASETSAVVDAIADAMSPRANTGQQHANDDVDGFPKSGDAARMWQPIGSRVKTALGFLLLALPGERPPS